MTQYSWSVNTNGSWGNAADWGPNGLPTNLDTVLINVPGVTVSIGTGVAASAYILSTSGSGLTLSGGSLMTVHQASFTGAFSQTAGTYVVGGTGAMFYAPMSFTGGIENIVTGALQLNAGGSLAGTLTGAGVLSLQGGTTYINTGFVCRLNSIVVGAGGKLGFNTNFGYTHNVTVNGGVVSLFGHTLVLGGTAMLSGTVGYGFLNDPGTITLGSQQYSTTLDNGLVVNISNTMIQSNVLSLGASDSGAKIMVDKSGTYDINGNWNILNPSTVGSIASAGTFAKTGGGKLSQIDTSFVSTGTLQAAIGELQLNGLVNSVGGIVSGGGTLGIAGGQTTFAAHLVLGMEALHQESGLLVLNGAQSYAGEWDMSGGVLNLNSATAVLTLTGRESFDGGLVTGYGGGLVLAGTTEFDNVTIGGPEKISITGTVHQTGNITFGNSSNPVATIGAQASWLIEGDGNIVGAYGLIENAGTFGDVNGSGHAFVQSELSSTGTVVANSTLTLAGPSLLGGTLSGSGMLDLGGDTTLLSGLAIKVANLDISSVTTLGGNLTDAGVFTEYGNGVLDASGFSLGLSGTASLDQGTLTDFGTLSSAGQTTIGRYTVTGGATLLVSGHADQNDTLNLFNSLGAGTLAVAAGGLYNVLDNLDIGDGGGTVLLAGRLTESGTGIATIGGVLDLASAGTLVANDQTLTLTNGGLLSGVLAGTGRINMNAGTFTLAAGFSALSAGLQISGGATALLTANQAYAGDFISGAATVALGTNTLSLSGSVVLGRGVTLTGPGTLLASGSSTVGAINVSSNATLQITGLAQQIASIQVGDPTGASSTAAMAIAKGASDTLSAYDSVYGNGTLSVAGSLIAAGNGTSQIATSIVDTGVIAANLGTLQIVGSVTAASTGIFSIGSAGLLDFSNGSTIGLATGVSFAGAGTLRIDDLKSFGATIQNFTANDMIQISGLNGASLTGTYGNAADTSIVVSDGTNQITLAFSTAQTLSSISFTTGVGGLATLTHH